jgi:hypothetical protein
MNTKNYSQKSYRGYLVVDTELKKGKSKVK